MNSSLVAPVKLLRVCYRNYDELITSAKKMKEEGFECSTIVLDGRSWFDTDTRFCFKWDKSRYPKHKEIIKELQFEVA